MTRTRAILAAAADLPPAKARRIVSAIAAAETQDGKTQDARDDASEDDPLETAAAAMQRALEAAILPELEAILTDNR
jgi:hypothetical protein